jgi:hypothetical protein
MNQKTVLLAPKISESILYGVDYKPLIVGAFIFNKMFKTHGFTTGKPIRLYKIWIYMRNRVHNPNCDHYRYYGGKGVFICNEWGEFINFYNWAMNNGYADSLTIDRIDSDGNYEPNNCRWVTRAANNKNKKYRRDSGIFRKKKGFYFQKKIDGIFYCGGYSLDIEEVRKFKNKLLYDIANKKTDMNIIINRKLFSRDKITGRFIWI